MNPILRVIIPTHNRARFIMAALVDPLLIPRVVRETVRRKG
ncbi:MAG: hypothetical protein ACRDGM_06395 [bacterium]